MSISFDGIRHFLLQPIESFGISFLYGLTDRQIPSKSSGVTLRILREKESDTRDEIIFRVPVRGGFQE